MFGVAEKKRKYCCTHNVGQFLPNLLHTKKSLLHFPKRLAISPNFPNNIKRTSGTFKQIQEPAFSFELGDYSLPSKKTLIRLSTGGPLFEKRPDTKIDITRESL